MSYHQKAIVYTSDEKGQGKAVYREDDNGKITKKTKKIKSPDEIEKIYQNFGFNDPMLDVEEFLNFSVPSPFRILSGFADNFFGNRSATMIGEPQKDVLPKGVDVEKHRQRLRDLQEKKEEEKKYLQSQLEELKNIPGSIRDFLYCSPKIL